MKAKWILSLGISVIIALATTLIKPTVAQVPLTVREITTFTLLQGRSDWKNGILDRLSRSNLVFYPNGVFEFHAPGRTDVYPLKGSYNSQGNIIYFSATGGNGVSAETVMTGNLNRNTGVVNLEVMAGAGVSACVNGSCSGVNTMSHYQAQLVLN